MGTFGATKRLLIYSILVTTAAAMMIFPNGSRSFRLMLGSGSTSRKEILTKAGIDFIIRKPDIDEKLIGNRSIGTFQNAVDIVMSLGKAKAKAILEQCTSEEIFSTEKYVLITCDQVVLSHTMGIMEKPINADEARRFIRGHSSSRCQTVGSLVLTDLNSGKQVSAVDSATIEFKEIPLSIIEDLVSEGTVLHCAGGLMIEHPLVQPYIERIQGRLDSVMGLSLPLLESLLHDLL